MKKSRFAIISLAALVALYIVGCSEPELTKPQPPLVTVAKPEVRDVVDYAEFTGTTKSTDSVEIRARVKGFLQSANFTEGAIVDKDALLFVIEQAPFKAKLAAAEAALAKTEAELKLAEANVQRAEELVKTSAMSKEEYQTRIARRDAITAQILADKATIEQAKIDLGYTEIHSPVRGKVGRELVDPGNLVGADENTLLTTVVSMDPMYAYFDVSEPVVLEYLKWRRENETKQGEAKIYIGLMGEEGFPHEGRLDFLDNRVDPATGTSIIRGVFDNKQGFLYPGLFVRAKLPGETQKDALLVREDAIEADLGGKYVLVVGKDNIVAKRNVELGTLVDGMRVIRKGLGPDDEYITIGMQRARPGLPVRVERAQPVKKEAEKARAGDSVKPQGKDNAKPKAD